MKFAVLVRMTEMRALMVDSSPYTVQTHVFPSMLGESIQPIICKTLDGERPFCAIELR